MFLRITAAFALVAASVLGAPNPYFAPALQTLQNAHNQHYYVEIFGDSLSECYQSGSVVGDLPGSCPGVGVTAQAALWTYSLGLRLKELYGDGGSGLVPIASEIFGTAGATSSQWSLGPHSIVPALGPFQTTNAGNIGTLFVFSPGSGATVVGLNGKTVRVYYGVAADSKGGFHAIIDGVDRGLVGIDAYTGTSPHAAVASFTVGAGMHTLKIAPVSSNVYIWAAEGKNDTGVSMLNASFGSAKSQCFGQSTSEFAFHDLIPATEIPLGFAMYGKNEWYSGTSPSLMTQWLMFLIAHEQQRNPRRVLAMIDEPFSGAQPQGSYQQSDFIAASASAATATGVYHLAVNQDQPFTSFSAQSAAGLMTGDATHLDNQGQHVLGDLITASVIDESTIAAPISQWVHIVSRNSGKCLDIFGGPSATQAFAPLDQWDCWSGTNQTFRFDPVTGGYEITAQSSGLQLDILGGPSALANGTPIIQYPFWGGSNETWKVTPTGDGFFFLAPLSSGKNLDVSSQSTADGATVWQWDAWGGDNQQWAILAASN